MAFTISQKNRLETQLDGLVDWLNELSDARLKKEIVVGKWTIWQNAAHLISYQNIFLNRMKKILAENDPTFERFVADFDADFLAYEKFDKQTLIAKGIEKRNEINHFLFSLDQDQLQRAALHPVFGRNNITDWTEFFLLHEAHHLFTIFKMKQMPQ